MNPPHTEAERAAAFRSDASRPAWRPRLRRLTIQVLLAAFTVLIALQFVAGRFLYANGFEEAERRDLLARARHAQAVLQQGFATLAPAATDYAEWIATREFFAGKRPDYPQYNWQAWTFKRFDADLVFIVDLHGRPLLIRALDADREGVRAATMAETAALSASGPLWPGIRGPLAPKGYLMIGGTPYMWAAAMVRDEAEPPKGWLFLLRRLDARIVGGLEQTLDSRVRFGVGTRLPQAGLPAIPLRLDELRMNMPAAETVSATFVAGVLPGWASLDLTLSTDRPLMATMARVTRYFLLASLAAGVIMALAAVLWLQRRLLGPLHQIGQHLRRISTSSDLSIRLTDIGRGDEITGVAVAANQMLDQIGSMRSAELARDAAVASNRAKSSFLARMTHELRTPLNGVLGMTDLLNRTALSAQQRRYTDTIRHSAGSLLGIINDTLDFSKIEAGKLKLEERAFDLEEAVETAAEMLADSAQAKGLELVTSIQPGLQPAYQGDELRLRQILVNLLSNAVKFTDHGQVLVRVSAAPVEPVDGTSGDQRITVEITDSGVGVRPADQAMIFESFSQADDSGKRRHGGTGLGLAICRQLVGLMNGEIGVRSAAGQGATFWFCISLRVAHAEPETDRPFLAGRRLLVMMPPSLTRSVLVEYGTSWGAAVEEADDAAVALELLAERSRRGEGHLAVIIDSASYRARRDEIDAVRAAGRTAAAPHWLVIVPVAESTESTEGAAGDQDKLTLLTAPVRRASLRSCLQGALCRESTGPGFTGSGAIEPAPEPALGLSVLLVEDNPVNQEVATAMLLQLGCSVSVAHDGREGCVHFQRANFDVVLMDCEMPEMDGFEATQAIRACERQRGAARTPIIALTANTSAEGRERCITAGMDRFLSKPFLFSDLRRLLEQCRARAPGASRCSNDLSPACEESG